MDPMRFMESNDELEIALMSAIAKEYLDALIDLQENQANLIANAVWSAVK
jgi:hypothetical protein